MLNDFEQEKDIEKNGKVIDLLKPNQFILAQIIKEPISTKGPRISCRNFSGWKIYGFNSIFRWVSISQKIESKEERTRLKRLVNSIKPKTLVLL